MTKQRIYKVVKYVKAPSLLEAMRLEAEFQPDEVFCENKKLKAKECLRKQNSFGKRSNLNNKMLTITKKYEKVFTKPARLSKEERETF